MNNFLRLHNFSTRFDYQLTIWGVALIGLILRIFVAMQFLKAGVLKVKDWDSTLSLFREEYTVPLLSPEVAAVLGAGGELIFSALLLLGLFSRPAALGLFLVNIMAVISYPRLWTFDCPAAINDHFYWGMLLLVLIAIGPGKISLDLWLRNIFVKLK
ncbi:MAG: DoxX family protein [Cytophaga sp.]|nr:DoxX family protein [Undibacterium sp.]